MEWQRCHRDVRSAAQSNEVRTRWSTCSSCNILCAHKSPRCCSSWWHYSTSYGLWCVAYFWKCREQGYEEWPCIPQRLPRIHFELLHRGKESRSRHHPHLDWQLHRPVQVQAELLLPLKDPPWGKLHKNCRALLRPSLFLQGPMGRRRQSNQRFNQKNVILCMYYCTHSQQFPTIPKVTKPWNFVYYSTVHVM